MWHLFKLCKITWNGLRNDINKYVKKCNSCAQTNIRQKMEVPTRIILSNEPNERYQIDSTCIKVIVR